MMSSLPSYNANSVSDVSGQVRGANYLKRVLLTRCQEELRPRAYYSSVYPKGTSAAFDGEVGPLFIAVELPGSVDECGSAVTFRRAGIVEIHVLHVAKIYSRDQVVVSLSQAV